MKALIFAAGLGTRLKPLTDNKPKALVEIGGKPLLYYAIEKLKKHGVTSIIVNTHHFSEKIKNYLQETNFGIPIEISDETTMLLNTGGGLQNARWFFDIKDSFIVYNVDILSDINLTEMIEYHNANRAIATLAVMERTTSRYFLFDNKMNLCGWRNKKDDREIISKTSNNYTEFAFSGIQIINPEYFDKVPFSGVFPIVDAYLEIAKTETIKAYNHTNTEWCDIGKLHELEHATEIVKKYYS